MSLFSTSSLFLTFEFDPYTRSLEELKQAVTELASSNLNMKHENEIYESYLSRTDPKMLSDLEEEVMRLAAKERRSKRRYSLDQGTMNKLDLFSKMRHKADDETTRASIFRRSIATPSVTTFTSGTPAFNTIPHINIRLKFELIDRETELKRKGFEKFRRDALIKLIMLEQRTENLEMSWGDTTRAREEFLNSVVATGLDNITHRVTAEKFVGFMEKYLKKSGIEMCLLNLKIDNKRVAYHAVTRTLTKRAELAENKGILDMIILQREVQSNRGELETKVEDYAKLKAAFTPIERRMLLLKDTVTMQMKQLQELKDSIKKREISMQSFDSHISSTRIEIVKASVQLSAIKERRSQFVHIDEMGYLHVKLEIARLKKDIKNWLRRRKVQRAHIVFSTRRLKVLNQNALMQYSLVLL